MSKSIKQSVIYQSASDWLPLHLMAGKKWMGCKQLEKFGPSAPLPAAGTVMVTRERGIVTKPTIRQLLVSTRAANETSRNCTLLKVTSTFLILYFFSTSFYVQGEGLNRDLLCIQNLHDFTKVGFQL